MVTAILRALGRPAPSTNCPCHPACSRLRCCMMIHSRVTRIRIAPMCRRWSFKARTQRKGCLAGPAQVRGRREELVVVDSSVGAPDSRRYQLRRVGPPTEREVTMISSVVRPYPEGGPSRCRCRASAGHSWRKPTAVATPAPPARDGEAWTEAGGDGEVPALGLSILIRLAANHGSATVVVQRPGLCRWPHANSSHILDESERRALAVSVPRGGRRSPQSWRGPRGRRLAADDGGVPGARGALAGLWW